MNTAQVYLEGVVATLRALPADRIGEVVAILRQARSEGRRVFLFGNGGSAATASHFACDLAKLTRSKNEPDFKVIALTENSPTFSAYANDEGYEAVFAAQLRSLAEPGDVAIGLSASGRSANILRALEVARTLGLTTIGFTGFDGGKLKDKVDLCVIAAANDMQQVEDAHHVLQPTICRELLRA